MAGLLYGNLVNWGHPLNRELVAWWRPLTAGLGGGVTLHNVARPGVPGTLTSGPAWAPGPDVCLSLSFDGSDDYVNCGDPTIVDVGSSGYTWAAWVKPAFIPAISFGMIVGKDDNVSGRQFFWAYGTEAGITGLHFGMFSSNTAYYISRYSTASLNDGSWHYVTFRYSPSVGCYHSVDGVEAVETTATSSAPAWSGTMQATAATLCIGQRTYSGATNRWNGRIADVSMRSGGTANYAGELYAQARRGHPDTLRRAPRRAWLTGVPAAPGGFKAAWARGANVLIGAGRA